ncbi:AT-rich interactive domain-containing protein 1-like [Rutidosis leptorrhynchoides]|uniref:AT-rich interactive domain-containing protein 1-like n=1 Tax=Rutidosis leptorrhynchoides TaxID=125765 RepID=UPI003A99BC4D
MKKSKQHTSPKHQKSATNDWFSYMVDENKQLAIPIGPRFQTNVPEWTGPHQRKYSNKIFGKSDSSKWLGTVVWSDKCTNPETEMDVIGRGRSHRCDCYNPGSIFCVKRHISEKTAHLKKDLGPAFKIWKFDEMGEVVANLWKQSEQQKFARMLKANPIKEEE